MKEETDYRVEVAGRLATIETNQQNQDEKLDKILSQVQYTNGRVTKLETWQAVVKSNVALIAGIAGAVASALVSIAMGFLK
jgi:glucose-6-phosphate 1-dehydrogenase